MSSELSINWTKTGEDQWERSSPPMERYMYSASEDGPARYNMKATIMAKLHTSIDKKDLSLILRSAWLSVLYQVPNVTIQPNLIGEKVYTIKYNQATPSQQEAETWLDQTISEEFAKDVQDPLNYLDEQSTAIGQHKLPSNRMSNASLLVYYFLDKSDQVNRLAIICHANHAAFDGSGVYNCLNRLLLDTVTGINLPTKKAAPEEHFNAYLSPDIMQADHSKLTKDILNSYMLPLRAHNFSRGNSAQDVPYQPSEVRQILSVKETAHLIKQAKKLNITISQLAMAANFVPLFRQFPADSTAQVAYTIALNVRKLVPNLPNLFYGNAVNGVVSSFKCSELSTNVVRGKEPLNEEDAESLYQFAKSLTNKVHQHQIIASEESIAVGKVVEMILQMTDPKSAPASVPQGHVSDGILERYIQRQYIGEKVKLDIEDAFLSLQEPVPMVHGRTSTFRDRLCLAMAFDARAWSKQEVKRMAQEWADALVYIANNALPTSSSNSIC